MPNDSILSAVLSSLSLLFAAGCEPAPASRPADAPGLAGPQRPGPAAADARPEPPSEPEPTPIYGGQRVEPCGWPSVVALITPDNLCSGTLLHPQVVVYAAHCGVEVQQVRFGEAIEGPGLQRVVQVESCEAWPGGGVATGTDLAYCVLAEPVLDVPVVPPLVGCERDAVVPGAAVTLVGFGHASDGPPGQKRHVESTLIEITELGEARIGGNGADTCQGDSGGPAVIALPDGTWRVFGVTSWGGPCGQGGYSSLLPPGLPWLEERTGLDLTPCHDAEGGWSPGPRCTGFALEPGHGHGDWDHGCDSGPRSGPGASCGPAASAAGCVGACGDQAPAGCWCDAQCTEQGDCCPDASEYCPRHVATCEGWCGGPSPSGCWCDEACSVHDDCCSDQASVCS